MRKTARSFDPRQVMHRPDFEVFHYHDAKMQEVPLHHHDFYEVYCFLGGRVEFLESENPVTSLEDGIATFHVYVTPPVPNRDLEFVLEYDVNYFSTLFE